jgi:hypothetical protein
MSHIRKEKHGKAREKDLWEDRDSLHGESFSSQMSYIKRTRLRKTKRKWYSFQNFA